MKPVAQRLSKGNLGHDNLKNKQNESNNIPTKDVFANISKNKIKREIYLTFDDGLEAGTEEVLELLKEKKIKGTFFLIGKRIESMYKRNPYKCLELLKDIYENHAIGNHSYSHANEFYSSFYRDGGVVIKEEGSKKIRRTVVNDFIKAKNTIMYYLDMANGNKNPSVSSTKLVPLSKNQKKGVSRFPGTNTWYLKNRFIDIKATNRGDNLSIPVKDTENESKEIGKNYNIFGWDLEWKMNEPHANKLIRDYISGKINNHTFQYDNTDDTDPFFDLYDKEYIAYDRPIEKVKEIRDEMLDLVYYSPLQPFDNISKSPGKVVLLMHERMFRKGKLNNNKEVDKTDKSELEKLGDLIDYFIKIKAEFKTLDEY